MYTYNDLVGLHVELTSNCQASCPMCARNHHGGLENPLLQVNDIDLESFKQFVPPEFLKQLHTVTMCGNFGDPILNKDLISIVEYIATTSPETRIDVHTNGSARNIQWWESLARAMPKNLSLIHISEPTRPY